MLMGDISVVYSQMGLHMVFHVSRKLTVDKLVYTPITL